jgi:hypothetical protein
LSATPGLYEAVGTSDDLERGIQEGLDVRLGARVGGAGFEHERAAEFGLGGGDSEGVLGWTSLPGLERAGDLGTGLRASEEENSRWGR